MRGLFSSQYYVHQVVEHSGMSVITVKKRGKVGRPDSDGSRLLEHDKPRACKLGITSFLYCVFRALKLQWLQML